MDKLGIEPKLFIAQLVNFGIIMFVLSRFLYKPILGMLEKRKKQIEEGLKLTEKMQQEAEKMEAKRAQIVEEAKKEGIALIEKAKLQAKEEAGTIITEARHEAEEVKAKAKTEVEEMKKAMEKQVQHDAVDVGVAIAKRLLTQVMTKETQHALLKKHIKSLEHAE
jgi:F-type H+-transporting ATPase subunit b